MGGWIRSGLEWITAHAWAGALLGSLVGLLAVLLGALYNARLNRKRDSRMSLQEVDSIRVAIGSELRSFALSMDERFTTLQRYIGEPDGRPSGGEMAIRLRLPPPVLYVALAGRIGMLKKNEVLAVVQAWSLVDVARLLLEASIESIASDNTDKKLLRQRVGFGLDACVECHEAADLLIGPVPPPQIATLKTEEEKRQWFRDTSPGARYARWRVSRIKGSAESGGDEA